MHSGELEQRQVQLSGEAPDLRPIDLAQEVGFVQFALGPAVEHRLDAPREHLETEDHVGVVAEQRRDRMKLPAMVLRLIVRLAEQHDAALGKRYERVVWFFVAARVNPCADEHAASGLRCKWSRMVSLFRVLGRLRRLKRWYTTYTRSHPEFLQPLLLSDFLRFRDRWMRVPPSPPTITVEAPLRREKLRMVFR